MLPDDLTELVKRFAESDNYLAYPDEAENMCGIATHTFTVHAKVLGLADGLSWARCFRPKDITRPHRHQHLSNFHVYPVWDGIAIDFTARQFWLEAGFPHIENMGTYMMRFARVELFPLSQMGWPEGGKPISGRFDFGLT